MDKRYIETHLEDVSSYDFMGRSIVDGVLRSAMQELSDRDDLDELKYNAVIRVSKVERSNEEVEKGLDLCLKVDIEIDTPFGPIIVEKHIKL